MSLSFIVFIIVLILTFLNRMPITSSMIIASLIYFVLSPFGDPTIAINKLVNVFYTQYILMAVPLFIFTAQVMNSGKVTDRMFKFANSLVGSKRGATAHVNVIASLIFSGMTGSAVADASGLGKMEIEQMRDEGYDDGFSCAITAASATIGPIFPPSIPMVVYAMLTGTSIGALFFGGMLPGFVLAIGLMIYVAYIARKRNYPQGTKHTLNEFISNTVKSVPALLTPAILLLGIYTGAFTPTEAGAIAALYALLVSIFVYRILGFNQLKTILYETVLATGTVTILIGTSAIVAYIFTFEQVGVLIANSFLSITSNKYVFLLIINLLFLILGMLLDVAAIQLVFIPIILPIAQAMNIDLVHLGVVITLNMMIGLSTPPFGILLFVTSGVSNTKLKDIIKEIIPIIIVMLIVLMLITYIPSIVLYLPSKLL